MSSFTIILRSASLAFLEMLRVCCGPQTSRFCRVTLRIHDVHCGSSAEPLNEAIARVVVRRAVVQVQKSVDVQQFWILATGAEGGSGRARHTLRPPHEQTTNDGQRDISCWAAVGQWILPQSVTLYGLLISHLPHNLSTTLHSVRDTTVHDPESPSNPAVAEVTGAAKCLRSL